MQERLFVLKPLVEYVTLFSLFSVACGLEHPTLYRTCNQLLADLLYSTESTGGCYRVYPIRDQVWKLDNGPTILMGILNTTPDSFSDGSNFYSRKSATIDVTFALEHARKMVSAGAMIIDIGIDVIVDSK